MTQRFEGLVAIVTGAASGIGRAVAMRLSAEGARVVATDLAESALEDLRSSCSAGTVVTHVGDVTAHGIGDELLDLAGGRVDVLTNVAGVADDFLPAGETTDELWERVMSVNLTAPMRLMRAVIPGMLERRSGSIVNVTSEAGLKGGCAGAAYTASKHGLVGLTKNSAFLYAPHGVRVNGVAPGPTHTAMRPAMRSQIAAERIPALIKASVSGLATPEQLAASIAWLASGDADNVTGVILPSDGGWSAA